MIVGEVDDGVNGLMDGVEVIVREVLHGVVGGVGVEVLVARLIMRRG